MNNKLLKIVKTKLNILFAIIILAGATPLQLFIPRAFAASIPRFSTASGNWSDFNTWSDTACDDTPSAVPLGTDTVTICSGDTVTLDSASAVSIDDVIINNGGTLIVTTGGTLTSVGDLTVNVGGTLNVTGGNISAPTKGLKNSGNVTISGGIVSFKDLTEVGTTSMSGGKLVISHDFKPTTPSNFSATGGTVEFSGSNGGAGFGATGTNSYSFYNLLFSAGTQTVHGTANTLLVANDLLFTGSGAVILLASLNTANALYVSGAQQVAGTWGSADSTATNSNDTYFVSGTGLVTIATSPDITPPADPVASPIAGNYNSNQNVTLTSTGSSTIRYSTSATPSTCSSVTEYTSPILVTLSQTLYALACDTAGNTSSASFAYVIDKTDPTIDAGADKTESTFFTQTGSSTDPSGSGIASRLWTTTSGPGTIVFGTYLSDTTTVEADADGTYVIRLSATDNAGNTSFDEFNLVWDTSSLDNDGDGLTNGTEDSSPNFGDANDDGIADKDQSDVTSLPNGVTQKYAALESSDCNLNSDVSIDAESTAFADTGYDYPFGLMNFTLYCQQVERSSEEYSYSFVNEDWAPTATVTQYYYGTFDATKLILRKYDSTTHTYQTITDAVITNITIDGQPVVKVVYSVTDGGPLDQDGEANGIIVDPSGLASVPTQAVLSATTSVIAPNTGLQRQSVLSAITLIFTATGLILVAGAYGKRQPVKNK